MSEEKPPRKRHKTQAPPLSAREIRFAQLCFEYGARGKERAYLEAGFPPKACAADNQTAACRLYRKRQLREYFRHLQDVAAEAAKVTTEEIVAGIAAIAKADRRKLFDKRGNMLPPDQWPDDVAAAIEGIETEEIFEVVSEPGKPRRRELVGHTRKVKTGSRQAAWRTLAEIKRMLGQDKAAADSGKREEPFRVGGEADPSALGAP